MILVSSSTKPLIARDLLLLGFYLFSIGQDLLTNGGIKFQTLLDLRGNNENRYYLTGIPSDLYGKIRIGFIAGAR